MFRNIKIILAVLAIIIVAAGAYAFAAQNVVPDSAAGYVAATVDGYDITNVVYDLNTTDPTVVDAITFDIAPLSGTAAAVTVKVQAIDGGAWNDCSVSAGVVTCTYGSLNVVDIDALNIVASSSLDP
jgi:hypothetical protein